MWPYQLAYTCIHTRAYFLVPCSCTQSFVGAVWDSQASRQSLIIIFFLSVKCLQLGAMPMPWNLSYLYLYLVLLLSPHQLSTMWFFITCGTRNIYCVDCHTQAPCIPWSSIPTWSWKAFNTLFFLLSHSLLQEFDLFCLNF